MSAERELDAIGAAVEAVGEMAEQEERSGPEGREPERLRVAGAGVVAERVDDRVGPGLDGERGGHGFSRRGRRGRVCAVAGADLGEVAALGSGSGSVEPSLNVKKCI